MILKLFILHKMNYIKQKTIMKKLSTTLLRFHKLFLNLYGHYQKSTNRIIS